MRAHTNKYTKEPTHTHEQMSEQAIHKQTKKLTNIHRNKIGHTNKNPSKVEQKVNSVWLDT